MELLTFIAIFVSLGSTPSVGHPLENQNLLAHGPSGPENLSSLISLEAPQYTSASPAFQMQALNLSYTTVTVRHTHTVTAVQYRSCIKVAPETPPCRRYLTAPAQPSISASVTTAASLHLPLLASPQAQILLKSDAASSSEHTQPQSSGSGTNDPIENKSQNFKVDAGSSVNALSSDTEELKSEKNTNSQKSNFRLTDNEEQMLESNRTPRLVTGPSNIVITKSVIENLTSTVTVTDSQTTVAVTYGGCVPHDVVTATACGP